MAEFFDPETSESEVDERSEDLIEKPKIDTSRILSSPRVEVDFERYAHFLDTCDADEATKREFAQLLWSIMFEFVSLGFEIHPVQMAQKIGGKRADAGVSGCGESQKLVE